MVRKRQSVATSHTSVAVLTPHDVKIAPSTYYDARGRGPSPREASDERWKPIILTSWQKQRKVLGARKLWLRLRREGHDIARSTVERLMRDLGIAGVVRGKRKRPIDTAGDSPAVTPGRPQLGSGWGAAGNAWLIGVVAGLSEPAPGCDRTRSDHRDVGRIHCHGPADLRDPA